MKFKTIFLLLLGIVSTATFAQVGNTALGGPVHIDGQIVGAEGQKVMLVNKNMGGITNPIATAQADKEGKFILDTTIAIQDYYFLRLENGQLLNLVLSPNDKLTIYGDGKDMLNLSNIVGSEHSVLLNQFLIEHKTFKVIEDSLMKVLRGDVQKQNEVNAYFSPIAQQFYGYRNNFINTNTSSPALVGALSAIDQKKEWEAYKQVVALLSQSFGPSPTVQNLQGYILKKDAQMKQLAEASRLKEELFKPGSEVKEISMPDPDGEIINLSDLRGNVVLIDFWASWCGPCRKENPNVVSAYKKYNKDGFEVFSVSLDKKGAHERWVAAIKQDGLIWPGHVSTLEGFATQAARDYMVNSIPFTVLIDAEGKVIAANLRGSRLESELKRIFGH